MLEEELQKMQKSVEDARERFVELNDKYNEFLTKEHEKKARKNLESSKMLPFFNEADAKPMSEEEIMLSKISLWRWIRGMVVVFLEIFGVLSLFPAMVIIIVNAIYSFIRTSMVRNKYKNEGSEKKEDVQDKIDKDALYEEVFEARRLYHSLRKEYESKSIDFDFRKKEENNEGVNDKDNNLDPQIYQIYSDYIEYVKNISADVGSRCLDNKRKVYEMSTKNL